MFRVMLPEPTDNYTIDLTDVIEISTDVTNCGCDDQSLVNDTSGEYVMESTNYLLSGSELLMITN